MTENIKNRLQAVRSDCDSIIKLYDKLINCSDMSDKVAISLMSVITDDINSIMTSIRSIKQSQESDDDNRLHTGDKIYILDNTYTIMEFIGQDCLILLPDMYSNIGINTDEDYLDVAYNNDDYRITLYSKTAYLDTIPQGLLKYKDRYGNDVEWTTNSRISQQYVNILRSSISNNSNHKYTRPLYMMRKIAK